MTQDNRLKAIRIQFKNNNNPVASFREFHLGLCRRDNTTMLGSVPTQEDPLIRVFIGLAIPRWAQVGGTGFIVLALGVAL